MSEQVTIKHKDYWSIRFHPSVAEWQYLVDKLIRSVKILAWNDWLMSADEDTGDVIFQLYKERYPAELIAKTFGLTAEKVRRLEKGIVLDAPKQNKDTPKPNVAYWGEA